MAKTKKVAGKKTSGNKAPPKKSVSRNSEPQSVLVEVVPDLMPSEVVSQIAEVDWVLQGVAKKPENTIAKSVINYANLATGFSQKAVQFGASALVYAWACGKLLNAAKKEFGHGKFGEWKSNYGITEHVSERTSQRYMKLAAQCDNIKELLEWSPSLRQAYIACGVLPEPEIRDVTKELEAPKTCALLSSLSGLQKSLRLFSGSGENLEKGDLTQLKLMRTELNRFFAQIITDKK